MDTTSCSCPFFKETKKSKQRVSNLNKRVPATRNFYRSFASSDCDWRVAVSQKQNKKKEETGNNESENPRSNTSKTTLTESEKEAIFEIKDLLKQV